ncbi:MAG: hypothetical protein [Caudoviricetes sp.]|nr:MAG: hypothetical protein [Caudoviricetes sp.]
MASNTNNQKAPHDIHTGYPGFVYNFNPVDQTCEVQLAIESLFVGTKDAYQIEPKQRLQKVPVQFIQGGGFSLTHPVPDGTPCYVHFAERGIEHWLAEGKDAAGMTNNKPAPAFSQLFSHNAAVCIIGLQPLTKSIAAFQNNAFEMRNADRSIRIVVNNANIWVISGSTQIQVGKSGVINITGNSTLNVTTKGATTIKAPTIKLDSNVTVTGSLTVQGGMAVSGTLSGATSTITGDMVMTGSFTLNGIKVDNHSHKEQGDGNDVGPMKAGA